MQIGARRASLHGACQRVLAFPRVSSRVNVTLDDEHAEKLRRLAERTHTNEGTIARSLLSSALDEVDPDPRNVTELLDGIDGAFERARRGHEQGLAGEGIALEDL